jgi:hypothetical protein
LGLDEFASFTGADPFQSAGSASWQCPQRGTALQMGGTIPFLGTLKSFLRHPGAFCSPFSERIPPHLEVCPDFKLEKPEDTPAKPSISSHILSIGQSCQSL